MTPKDRRPARARRLHGAAAGLVLIAGTGGGMTMAGAIRDPGATSSPGREMAAATVVDIRTSAARRAALVHKSSLGQAGARPTQPEDDGPPSAA